MFFCRQRPHGAGRNSAPYFREGLGVKKPNRIDLTMLEAERSAVLKQMASRVAQRSRLKDEFEDLMDRSIHLAEAIRKLRGER